MFPRLVFLMFVSGFFLSVSAVYFLSTVVYFLLLSIEGASFFLCFPP